MEALIHADDPNPAKCDECQSLISAEHCPKCGAPRHRLTRRFRDFFAQYGGDASEEAKTFASRLYAVRSGIAHRGVLLRSDEFDSGFNLGGKDNQWDFYDLTWLVRRVLLGWFEKRMSA